LADSDLPLRVDEELPESMRAAIERDSAPLA
jgi:hypothetical protein